MHLYSMFESADCVLHFYVCIFIQRRAVKGLSSRRRVSFSLLDKRLVEISVTGRRHFLKVLKGDTRYTPGTLKNAAAH